MALPWAAIAAMAGAGLGALQYPEKKKQAQAERQLNAEMMRYSPWTGMQPSQLVTHDPSLIGEIVKGGAAGLSFGSQFLGGSDDKKDGGSNTQVADTGDDSDQLGLVQHTPVDSGQMMSQEDPNLLRAYKRSIAGSSPWAYMPTNTGY